MSDPPHRSPWLVTAVAGGETVIYDPVRDGFHVLNPTATLVWDLVDGRRPETEIAKIVGTRYGNAQVASDVHELIEALGAAGLLLPLRDEGALVSIGPPPRSGNGAVTRENRSISRVTAPLPDRQAVFRALDYTFTIDGDDASLMAAVTDVLRDLQSSTGAAPTRYRLRCSEDIVVIDVDGKPVSVPVARERVTHMLLWHVNQQAVRRSVDRHVILHAAAVEREGAVVLLPGGMERGKTTTAAGLVRAGYRYLSDELAAIEPETLRVRPYPKPLGIDPGSHHVLADLMPTGATAGDIPWQVPVTTIRADVLSAGGRPVAIVAPQHVPHAATELEPLTPGRMAVHLADCAFGFRDRPHRDLAVLARLAEACACYRLTVSTLDAAVRLVDAALGATMRSLPDSMSGRGR